MNMMHTKVPALLAILIVSASLAQDTPCGCGSRTEPSGRPVLLIVANEKGETITYSPAEFAALDQTRVEVTEKDGTQASYEGVPLGKLLALAGIDFAGLAHQRKDGLPLLAHCVLVEATDGYQIIYTFPEVDPGKEGPPVLVAQRKNGQPLGTTGPFQIIDPQSTVHARWVRQVSRILVRPVGLAVQPGAAAEPATVSATAVKAGLYLVGFGPGDRGLLTVRARQILQHADRIYGFHWQKEDLSAVADPAKIVVASPYLMGGRYLGTDPADFDGTQRDEVTQANAALAEFATDVRQRVAAGKVVAIVADGDPTIYSPWGWIPEHLVDLKPTVVPGISSFNAANAALKHGAVGASYYMLSAGHDLPAPDQQGRLRGVLVLFTHTVKFADQVDRLQKAYPGDTPMAVVCDASYPTERVIRSSLDRILADLGTEKLPHLYLIYVGDGLGRNHNSR